MAKVLEGPGMGLMKKWGINVPNYVVVTSVDELTKLGQANEWLKKSKLVAKAHEALGSRFKLGLVKVDLDFKAAEAATKEMIGRLVGSITVTQVIVSEMIPHKEEYYCAVKSTASGVDPVTHRLAVRAELPNPQGMLKPEMFASMTILGDDASPAVGVPEEGVIFEGEGARVWVLQQDGSLVLRPIKVGRHNHGLIEVLSGLNAGDSIVTRGSLFIDRAAKSD